MHFCQSGGAFGPTFAGSSTINIIKAMAPTQALHKINSGIDMRASAVTRICSVRFASKYREEYL